jgi:hypothetical protein
MSANKSNSEVETFLKRHGLKLEDVFDAKGEA